MKHLTQISIMTGIVIMSFACSKQKPSDNVSQNSTQTETTNQEKANNEVANNTQKVSSYDMITTVFEGKPSIEEVKPLMEAVMTRHKLPITEENLSRVGSMLLDIRKEVHVSEMQILQHMYQNGSDKLSIQEQAAISATILEKKN